MGGKWHGTRKGVNPIEYSFTKRMVILFFFKQHGPPCLLFFLNLHTVVVVVVVETFEDHLFAGQMGSNAMNTSYTISSRIMALAGTTGTSAQKKRGEEDLKKPIEGGLLYIVLIIIN